MKSQMKELLEAERAAQPSVEDQIEEERAAVDAKTPITEQVGVTSRRSGSFCSSLSRVRGGVLLRSGAVDIPVRAGGPPVCTTSLAPLSHCRHVLPLRSQRFIGLPTCRNREQQEPTSDCCGAPSTRRSHRTGGERAVNTPGSGVRHPCSFDYAIAVRALTKALALWGARRRLSSGTKRRLPSSGKESRRRRRPAASAAP